MDGQNRTKLVDSKIVFPHGITLDLVNRLVYWADAYLDYIEVVDYEGKGRQTIIQGILVRGVCLRLFLGNHQPESSGEEETFRELIFRTPSECGKSGVNQPMSSGGASRNVSERKDIASHSDGNSHLKTPFYFLFLI